jgi:hypothetical protein
VTGKKTLKQVQGDRRESAETSSGCQMKKILKFSEKKW